MERKINPRSFLASNNESLRFYSVYFDQVLISSVGVFDCKFNMSSIWMLHSQIIQTLNCIRESQDSADIAPSHSMWLDGCGCSSVFMGQHVAGSSLSRGCSVLPEMNILKVVESSPLNVEWDGWQEDMREFEGKRRCALQAAPALFFSKSIFTNPFTCRNWVG